MNKCIIVCALLGLLTAQSLCAQPEETADSQSKDFPAGRLRQDDVQGLRDLDAVITKSLSQAPDNSTGKQSAWYPKLQAWKASLDKAVVSGSQEDAFKVIPQMAEYFARNKNSEDPEHYLRKFENQMYDAGHYLIMAAGAYIQQHNGEVDTATLSNLVKLFSVHGFFMEPDWEEQPAPVGPQDLMTINPTLVAKLLESGPWEQARQFTGGVTSAANFFAGYGTNGSSLAVLRAKYAQNKPLIDAKFNELVAWEARQERERAH